MLVMVPAVTELRLQFSATTLQQLRSARIIACLRASSSKLALDAAGAALDGGLAVLEVTMNTPQAAQVTKVLVREYPSAIIGAGTVLSTKEADLAKDAGAKFLMSLVTVEEIVQYHRNGPVVHIPGAMTPTEVISAYNFGAPPVKLYPMSLLGRVPFMRTLSKPLGHIPMIPSNGVCLDMVEPYISAGAMAVIVFKTTSCQLDTLLKQHLSFLCFFSFLLYLPYVNPLHITCPFPISLILRNNVH
ncbi:unnamed protein product [Calypogeia fissa]